MNEKKVIRTETGRYGGIELAEGEQLVAFKHLGHDTWTFVIAPNDSLAFLRSNAIGNLISDHLDVGDSAPLRADSCDPVLKPSESGPTDPHYNGGKSL